MTDQTKLREAVARAIDPSAFTPSAHDKKALVDNAFRAAQRVLSLPEIADALKREEENYELRVMVALANTLIGVLYHDDGELQDASEHPVIDYKRDSVEQIKLKWLERHSRRAAMSGGKKK